MNVSKDVRQHRIMRSGGAVNSKVCALLDAAGPDSIVQLAKNDFSMGKKIYGEKISVGTEKRIQYKFILEHLEVKLHIEILSDAAIFLLLGILGVRVKPLGVILVLLEDRLVLLGLLELVLLNILQLLLLLLLLAFLISAHILLLIYY